MNEQEGGNLSIVSNSLHKNIDNNHFKTSGIRIDRGLIAKIDCDYCKTPLLARMFTSRIANFERFFCCREYRSAYKKKYLGRIEVIKKRHKYYDANLNMH